jgi:hypothetical protein
MTRVWLFFVGFITLVMIIIVASIPAWLFNVGIFVLYFWYALAFLAFFGVLVSDDIMDSYKDAISVYSESFIYVERAADIFVPLLFASHGFFFLAAISVVHTILQHLVRNLAADE